MCEFVLLYGVMSVVHKIFVFVKYDCCDYLCLVWYLKVCDFVSVWFLCGLCLYV